MVGQIDRQVVTPNMGWSSNGRAAMAPYAIRRRGLQAEIQHVVKQYIIDHQFRPGDPLPLASGPRRHPLPLAAGPQRHPHGPDDLRQADFVHVGAGNGWKLLLITITGCTS